MTPIRFPEFYNALPKVRGKYDSFRSLSNLTWFRVGGEADILFTPADTSDLQCFLSKTHEDIPVQILGAGSNCLVRDGGVRGVVIKLGKGFHKIEECSENRISFGAGVLDVAASRFVAQLSLSGLEFYRGIPGTIGGALRMNAGSYGAETADVFSKAIALDRQGKRHELCLSDMGFSYRHSKADSGMFFVSAEYKLIPGKKEMIFSHMEDINTQRMNTQPIRSRTGGSTFKNPENYKAWRLIDEAGCRGLSIGDAQISEKHCNFLINHGSASANDLEMLGETVRQRVYEHHKINLSWEIKRIGEVVC